MHVHNNCTNMASPSYSPDLLQRQLLFPLLLVLLLLPLPLTSLQTTVSDECGV